MARRFWVKLRNESIPDLYTPIVVSLASSNLKLDTFRHYISHDASSKSYELEEECTDDDDAKVSISQLRKNVLEELKLHNSFVQPSPQSFHRPGRTCIMVGPSIFRPGRLKKSGPSGLETVLRCATRAAFAYFQELCASVFKNLSKCE